MWVWFFWGFPLSLVTNTFTLMHWDVVVFIFILLRAQSPCGTCNLIAILELLPAVISSNVILPHFLPSLLLGLQIHACFTFLCILMSLTLFCFLPFALPSTCFFLFQFINFLLHCVKPVNGNLGSWNFPDGLVVRLCTCTEGFGHCLGNWDYICLLVQPKILKKKENLDFPFARFSFKSPL